MRLIADGVVDREGVAGLAARLGYSERQVHRLLVGRARRRPAGPRPRPARPDRPLLIETTALPITDVAFAAGFASVRQFNDTVREVFAPRPERSCAPARLARARAGGPMTVRLAAAEPFDADCAARFLGTRAVPGVEERDGPACYRRSLACRTGTGVVSVGRRRRAA